MSNSQDHVLVLTKDGWEHHPTKDATPSLRTVQEKLASEFLKQTKDHIPLDSVNMKVYVDSGLEDRVECVCVKGLRGSRHSMIFPVVQFSHETNRIRVILYGLDTMRYAAYGIGQVLSGLKLNDVLYKIDSSILSNSRIPEISEQFRRELDLLGGLIHLP